ncbi:exonuclease 1-like isoform X2 [Neltuma alba]|uniref:exonuclease 1-like isoform X2 n=1 Tax=Neltuma alba TaxID=207710 RepID=UPI0010A52582|nr:exonuclease 1-like isoform X2 [Prosopis alba]
MGIQGLLPQLKSIMVPIHIKQFEGCNVAVDTYSWLHKGALCCSTELCKGLPTSRHIEYCMRKVNLLRHYGVKPILVFDGGLLPMKSEQENKRARARKENLARAVELESHGNSTAAFECYQKAVDISPLVACELIQVLKQENVPYLVAPYEADAQMTFLAASKQVEAVITEDSDLVPFGCPRIIFKMDKFGQAVEFQHSMLQKNKELSFEGFTRQMLLEMCILSGCDYLQSLPGMGLKRAHAIIKRFKSYDKVLKHLRFNGVSVPSSYEESFKKAILTFQYQRVYNPIIEDIVHLSDVPADIGDELDFLGPSMPKEIAQGIAKGDLDPFTKMPFQVENCTAGLAMERASEIKTSHSKITKKRIDLPVQKNVLTKYFCFASLEAKRKFIAPRMSPTATDQSTVGSSSVNSQDHETLETASAKTKSSAASLGDCKILAKVPPVNNYVENRLPPKFSELMESSRFNMAGERWKNPEHTILQQPKEPIHKPCLGLNKDNKDTNVKDTIEVNTVGATRKVLVRSPYFQHKQAEKDNCDQKPDCLVEDDFAIGEHKNTVLDSGLGKVEDTFEGKTAEATRKVIARSPRFQHKQEEKNNCERKHDCLIKDDFAIGEHKNTISDSALGKVENTIERETTQAARKVLVRSPFFQHKQVEKIDCHQKQDCLVKDDVAIGEPENTISDNHMMNNALKRKISADSAQSENLQPGNMESASTLPDHGCDQNSDRTSTKGNSEEKFGANISHLGHYSKISEKSLEKFTLMLSSFTYTSSGSRASGLRAPLRDVQNTCNSRPKAVDIEQFAFAPKKQKTDRVSR